MPGQVGFARSGWKARKSICQQASPGFPRLCSGQGLRLRAISRALCDRSARRFAQDDGFVGGEKHPVSYAENTKRSKVTGSPNDIGSLGEACRPLKPKEGLNGPPKALVAGVASFVIHLSTRLRELAARDDTQRRVGFHWGSVARIPGLKSETWGTLRLLPTQ